MSAHSPWTMWTHSFVFTTLASKAESLQWDRRRHWIDYSRDTVKARCRARPTSFSFGWKPKK